MRGFFNRLGALTSRLSGLTAHEANAASFLLPKTGPTGRPSSAPYSAMAEMLKANRRCERPAQRGYTVKQPALYPKELWSLHCNKSGGRRPRGCQSDKYRSANILKDFAWSTGASGHLEFMRRPTKNRVFAFDETHLIKA